MTCEEVKNLLVDYLDKTLDTATTTRVATHLISCAPCGAQASDLAECISQVAALPALDPPLGFAQRVMAHVREIEPKPPLWERLISPWNKRAKMIPIQAAALIMVGIVGVLLYRENDNLTQIRMSETAMRAASAPTESLKPQADPATSAALEKTDTPPVKSARRIAPETQQAKETIAAPSAAREQVAALKPDIDPRLDENRLAKRPPIQVQEASNPSEAARFSGGAGFAPPVPLGSLRQTAPRSAPLALERMIPVGERVADYEYVVRRRPVLRREPAAGVGEDAAVKSVETDNLARPTAPASVPPRIESIAEIRFYNVAPEHFEFFKKELASEAIIETETKSAEKEKEFGRFDRQLLVKVTILPAAPPDSAAPPR